MYFGESLVFLSFFWISPCSFIIYDQFFDRLMCLTTCNGFRLALRRIITTFDSLRRAEINESEDVVELLYIFLGFLKVLDTRSCEQLNKDFELVRLLI